ncbi:hypothetical protein Tco_1128059 [Tanacetum coccineum]
MVSQKMSYIKWCLLNITLQAPFLNVQMTFEHSSSSLGHQCLMVSAENNTLGPAPFLNVQMTFEHSSSSLNHQCLMVSAEYNTSGPIPQSDQASVFMELTSDHNRSELGIQVHNNEQSSSKQVPKVVP